ncbi:MAG TPA: hypothetical protein VM389_15290 [Phycisphaerae bacterium]|nr:hypothetical protein [Phycisphaerae bacterium]
MTTAADQAPSDAKPAGWAGSLRFRLAAVVATVVLVGMAGSIVIEAQYLDHMESMLRRQMLARAISTGLIGAMVLLLLVLTVRAWVLKAAGREWSRRRFAARADVSGPRDLRSLAGEFNGMAAERRQHESQRPAEMAKARRIQAGFLPSDGRAVRGLGEIIARYVPAQDVAGDLYDLIRLPDGRTAIVGMRCRRDGPETEAATCVRRVLFSGRPPETSGKSE